MKDTYESKGPTRKAILLKRLLFSRMSEGEDMPEHLNKMFNTIDKLSELNVTVDGDILSILILYSIPSSFDNFRVAMESRDTLIDPDSLKIKILEEAASRQESYQNAEKQEALNVKGNKDKNFKNNNENKSFNNKNTDTYNNENNNAYRKNIKCNFCKRAGHIAANCWRKSGCQKSKESISNVEEALLAVASSVEYTDCIESEECSIAVALYTKELSPHKWCLDSEATSHVTSSWPLIL